MSSASELHHRMANEIGIALGMLQLATKKLGQTEGGDEASREALRTYLEKALMALGRIQQTAIRLRELDSP